MPGCIANATTPLVRDASWPADTRICIFCPEWFQDLMMTSTPSMNLDLAGSFTNETARFSTIRFKVLSSQAAAALRSRSK